MSPPPPCSIRGSATSWVSCSLRRDGEDDWEEVIAAGARAAATGSRGEATEEQDAVFGAPPTDDEVRAAVASIKQVFEKPSVVDTDGPELALALPISAYPSSGIFENHFAIDSDASEVGSESDEWGEYAMLVHNSSALLTKEHQIVLDAYNLFNKDPSIQKMVMALSTDKAVWQAVTNNEVVREFKRSFQDAKETTFKESSTAAPGFMMWVLENTQAKLKEFLEKILGLVDILFQAGDKDYDASDDVVRMSFMLSVFVFIVQVTEQKLAEVPSTSGHVCFKISCCIGEEINASRPSVQLENITYDPRGGSIKSYIGKKKNKKELRRRVERSLQ